MSIIRKIVKISAQNGLTSGELSKQEYSSLCELIDSNNPENFKIAHQILSKEDKNGVV